MIPYYLLYGIPVLLYGFRAISKKTYPKKVVLTVFFVLFAALLCLRHTSIGVDTSRYRDIFEATCGNPLQLDWSWDAEVGFKIFTWIISRFTQNFQLYLAVLSVLSLLPVFVFYIRDTEYPILTTVMFLTVAPMSMYFSGLRQIMAMGFFLPAWDTARKKKVIPFLLYVLAAMLFHKSAIVLLFLYPLTSFRITLKRLIFALPTLAVFWVFRLPIFRLLTRYFYTSEAVIKDTGSTTMLYLLIGITAMAYVLQDESTMDDNDFYLRNILLFSAMVQSFAPFNTVVMRMNYYYLLFIPALMPRLFECTFVKYKNIAKIICIAVTVYLSYYFFKRAYTSADILHIYPYHVFWESI